MGYEVAPVRGVLDHYGKRTIKEKFGGDFGTKDGVKQAVYEYGATDLPANDSGYLAKSFPAGTKIESVYTEVVEDIVGLTAGTVQAVIGSYDSGADALTGMTAGNGAKDEPAVPTSIGSTASKLVVTLGGTGSATAGRLRTIVTYVMATE